MTVRGSNPWVAIGLGLVVAVTAACGQDPRPDPAEQSSASPFTRPRIEPRLGACYDLALTPYASRAMWADLTPSVPCTEPHQAETYHVGTVDAPPNAAQVQPRSQQMFALFAGCAARASEFLGGQWYDARIELQITLPLERDWTTGNRAYSCEMAEIAQPGDEGSVRRTSSLRGALTAPGPLAMTCFTRRSTVSWTPLVPAGCDQPHDAEYVGSFDGIVPASDDPKTIKQIGFDGCDRVTGSYVGSPEFPDIAYLYIGWDPYYWHSGRVTVQCFAAPVDDDKRFGASVKGIGGRRPPLIPTG